MKDAVYVLIAVVAALLNVPSALRGSWLNIVAFDFCLFMAGFFLGKLTRPK